MDEALETNAQLLRDNPDFATAYGTRSMLLESRGDLVGALRNLRARAKSDPGARGRLQGRCLTMLRFGALAEAEACADQVAIEVGEAEVVNMRIHLLNSKGKFEEAYALLLANPGPRDSWQVLAQQYLTQRYDEALAGMKQMMPELFEKPAKLTSNFPGDAVMAGTLLVGSGATEQGRELLHRALKANAARPHGQFMYGRAWSDVYSWGALGDTKQACAAIREAVAADYFFDLATRQ